MRILGAPADVRSQAGATPIDLALIWPNSAEVGPRPVETGRSRVELCSALGRNRPTSAKLPRNRPPWGRIPPIVADIGQTISTKLVRGSTKLGPKMINVDYTSPGIDEHPGVDHFGPEFRRVWPHWGPKVSHQHRPGIDQTKFGSESITGFSRILQTSARNWPSSTQISWRPGGSGPAGNGLC